MPLSTYRKNGFPFNQDFLETTSALGMAGYRGELVLIQGKFADDNGHHKPPVATLRRVVILAGEKSRPPIGALHDIAPPPALIEKYRTDLADDVSAFRYAIEIDAPYKVDIDRGKSVLIRFQERVPWNQETDELALEESDVKGRSTAETTVSLRHQMKSYRPKYRSSKLDEVPAAATDVKRRLVAALAARR